jgi:hypothetical protein
MLKKSVHREDTFQRDKSHGVLLPNITETVPSDTANGNSFLHTASRTESNEIDLNRVRVRTQNALLLPLHLLRSLPPLSVVFPD